MHAVYATLQVINPLGPGVISKPTRESLLCPLNFDGGKLKLEMHKRLSQFTIEEIVSDKALQPTIILFGLKYFNKV